MSWLDWLIIGSIALLAGAFIGAWQQWGPYYLNNFTLSGRKRSSPEAPTETATPAVPHQSRAQRYPAEEPVTDGLAGVMARDQFMKSLEAERQRSFHIGGQFCVAILDLDRFKQLNDRKGRSECEKVLATVAKLLGARSRQSNKMARYGGDEFAILMPEASTLQAEILAERLRAALEADDVLRAREITVSIGIGAYPSHGRSTEEILRMADSGVRLAKKCGGNCVKVAWLSPKPEDAERDKRLLESCLEAAEKGMFPAVRDGGQGASPIASQPESGDSQAFLSELGAAGQPAPANAVPINPLLNTITALAFAVQAKGPHMKDHSQVVSRLAAQTALQAGLPEADVEEIRLAGLVHDIGKIRVPEYVLRKPTLLTAQEFEIMKSHAAWGAKMVEILNVKAIERIVLHHHERYDGKGYPAGLVGDNIPLGARMIAVAESFHNMVSDLRYKSARTFEDALVELRRCSGTQFDPQVVTTFLEWIQAKDARPSRPPRSPGGGGGGLPGRGGPSMKSDWRQSPYLFHVHTTYTDGDLTVAQIVRFAAKAGASTVVFLEHIQREPRYNVKRFMSDVKRAGRGTVRTVLGFEANLLPDGTLDISEDCLESAAVVGIAEHDFPNAAGLLRDSFLSAVRTCSLRWPQVTLVWVHPGHWFFERYMVAEREESFQQMLAEACRAGVLIEQNLKYGLVSRTTAASLPAASLVIGVDAHSLFDLESWADLPAVETLPRSGPEEARPTA